MLSVEILRLYISFKHMPLECLEFLSVCKEISEDERKWKRCMCEWYDDKIESNKAMYG